MIFRIDDICGNTNILKLKILIELIPKEYEVMLVFSPLYLEDPLSERVFPQIYKAYSDHRIFYKINKSICPIQYKDFSVIKASHGLIHVDHRLLGYEGQEMSILTASNIIGSDIFVPPFHKWNNDTETICKEHNIKLIKFEDGWKHAKYNLFNSKHDKWYMHTFDFSIEEFKKWVK